MTLAAFFGESGESRKVAVLGCAGMLGRAFSELLGSLDVEYDGADQQDFDLGNPESVTRSGLAGYDIVINCAAWTDVDGAETHEADALAVNGGAGLERLCQEVAESGGLLVHFSTDYVFNGEAREPYPVDHPHDPVNAYGRTKAAGERIIRDSECRHLVIRTSWLYAPWGNNFVRTIARLCTEKPSLDVVNDQHGRPTSCEQLARTTVALVEAGSEGVMHACDSGSCTWFEFAQEIARLQGSGCAIQPCETEAFPRPAPRPSYSLLDLARTEAMIGQLQDWKSGLAHVMSRLEC